MKYLVIAIGIFGPSIPTDESALRNSVEPVRLSALYPPRIHSVLEFNCTLAAFNLFVVISCVFVHWEFLKEMHESSSGKGKPPPPQRIGVEPRSPPTATILLDGMSPNGDEDEDELTSMTSVSRLFP